MPPTSMNRTGRLGEHALPLMLSGIGLWVIGALIVRILPGLFESQWRTLLALVVAIPTAELLLMLLGAMLGIERAKRLPAAACLAVVVIGCHALALVLWPGLYGAEPMVVHHGGAWLAWAGIAPVLCAWLAAERR
jgi:hypothetical protein